ncbi:hypothetical protein GCM10022281_18950 [Sphingomonas rosea]|uniref:UrcA family protein n=1 Tax=Sphingomonas rosea TaxID=335605 RepID=A0ABP7U9G4_9SPHN
MLKLVAIAALTTASASVAVASPAPQDANEIVITVTAQDLSSAGHKQLMRRIGLAAEELCGSYAARETAQHDEVSLCRDQVFRSADQQIASLGSATRIRLAAR